MTRRPKSNATRPYSPPPSPREELASLLASLPLTAEQRRDVQLAADALAIESAARVLHAARDSVQRHMHDALGEAGAAYHAVEDAAFARFLTSPAKEPA